MTQDELKIYILKLKCCSAKLADKYVNDLIIGNITIDCYNFQKLIILNNSIKELLKYNIVDTTNNCLSEDNFDTLINNTTDICSVCNCT
jgi:hypothetical protein